MWMFADCGPEEFDEDDTCHHGVGFDEECEDCDEEEEFGD